MYYVDTHILVTYTLFLRIITAISLSLLLLLFFYLIHFVHTCVVCHRSTLKYKIISETWCISICLCLGAAWGAWKHAPM